MTVWTWSLHVIKHYQFETHAWSFVLISSVSFLEEVVVAGQGSKAYDVVGSYKAITHTKLESDWIKLSRLSN